jgi:hypothetical protein
LNLSKILAQLPLPNNWTPITKYTASLCDHLLLVFVNFFSDLIKSFFSSESDESSSSISFLNILFSVSLKKRKCQFFMYFITLKRKILPESSIFLVVFLITLGFLVTTDSSELLIKLSSLNLRDVFLLGIFD